MLQNKEKFYYLHSSGDQKVETGLTELIKVLEGILWVSKEDILASSNF